MNTFILELYNY